MTKIKLCGLSRPIDIETANEIMPDYIGFVFAKKSKRYVDRERATELKSMLNPYIRAVGVFVNEEQEVIAGLLDDGIIDIAQLHGSEDDDYIKRLRMLTDKPIIKAFTIDQTTVAEIEASSADYVLIDSGAGSGETFNWDFVKNIERPYFLAGGLSPENVKEAVAMLHPFGVDVSSGIETDGPEKGIKDPEKMKVFAARVRAVDMDK